MSEQNKEGQAGQSGKPPAEGDQAKQADQGQNAGEGTGPQTAEPATDEPKGK